MNDVLIEATRKLVEGRPNPSATPRGFCWERCGQRVVWLTREEWESYRDALAGLDALGGQHEPAG